MPKTFIDLVRDALRVIREIDAPAAGERLGDGKTVFLDVREPDEVAYGTVPDAAWLPLGALAAHVSEVVPDRAAPLVVYCAGGYRSAVAAKALQELGYADVQSLRGGFQAWTASGHPVGRPKDA